MADTFWKDTTDFLLTSMGTDLFDKSANLITSIAPLFSIGFGIYFMIIILNAYGRGFDGNAVDFAKKTVACLIIIMCAFNAAQYQKIANMLYEFPEWLSSTFNGQFDASAIDTAWDSIMKAVENILASYRRENDYVGCCGYVDIFRSNIFFYCVSILFSC